jgi:trehalose 6-phosphate synthase
VSEHVHWLAFARQTPLALLTDLDGTLIPFAASPEAARPTADLLALLADLACAPGVTLAVVSGRPRDVLESFFAGTEGILLVAEHGGWRRSSGAWEPAVESSQEEVEDLAESLRRLAGSHPGARLERKTWSLAFHFRAIPSEARDAAVIEVETRVAEWIASHPRFVEMRGAEVLEVRPARMNKGEAVAWVRERSGAHLCALGDDITDEDMFRALGAADESIVVGRDTTRATAARWQLDGPEEGVRFVRWVLGVRRGQSELGDAAALPRRIEARPPKPGPSRAYRLLVVSNRLPELRSAAASFDVKRRNVGGLVSALTPMLESRQGLWLGWSGRTEPEADPTRLGLDASGNPPLAWVDFPEKWYEHYYNGLCNGALWPLLHSFATRVRVAQADWDAYRQANDTFASLAHSLVGPKDTIWLHDYHLFLAGARLREHGHEGPIGLFLHVPFPGPDIFFILPWAQEVLTALLALDLLGFHTPGYAANFRQCAAALPGARVGDDVIEYRGRRTRIGAFPIGIIPEAFQEQAPATDEVEKLLKAIAATRLVLGVDRLDYTKGIPERLEAFARLFELHPEWRSKVSLVQISVPSRGDLPAYAEQRERVETIVGHTNGEFGDGDWVPIRYLYRSYGSDQLAQFYRASAIGYVTPLRDGMNLVAKEWVAAQNPDDPGVLVLSRFAGAAVELGDALITNPWHIDGLAHDLDRALRMGLDERREHHAKLLAAVSRTTALTWAEDFLATLTAATA